ncbi:MAG: CheR family methyltransferase, partial [Alteraurantiacibacter sp.]
TDIDESALSIARTGRYPAGLLANIGDNRRQRFFRKDGASWVVVKDLRDLCMFSPHSVISDPPFSRMDLVSCRNLLIYLGRGLQEQVIPTFHYALKPGGYLLLGSSESISQHDDLFAPIDQKLRVFQSRAHDTHRPRLPMNFGSLGRNLGQSETGEQSAEANAYQLRQRVERQVLERHVPAHVVVRAEGDIVHYSTQTARYLEMPRGAPNRHLLDLARPELRLELRAALRDAVESGRVSNNRAVMKDETTGEDIAVALTVEPLRSDVKTEKLFLVLFSQAEPIVKVKPSDPNSVSRDAKEAAERDIRDMHERLQSTVEEYETAIEELRSSNEELVSVNEEAQSTNEELEASKEETQSLNEELSTINGELNSKVVELDRTNSDLKNLHEATRIATIFLDDDLVIRNFTPEASTIFNLRDADVGRPLTELASALDYPELRQNIQAVSESGEMLERQLSVDDSKDHFLVRLNPYRDRNEDVAGVVVTLVDISKLARAEAQHRLLIEELNHRVKNMLAVVISIAKATLRNTPSPEAFTDTFIGRLQGMARAYALLSDQNWVTVALRNILKRELEAHDIGRFTLTGPDAELEPEMALSIGLVIHELATNAAKYGALSANEGHVAIDWPMSNAQLQVDWTETGGPVVSKPGQKGFGIALVEGQICTQLGGNMDVEYAPTGLIVKLSVPLGSQDA